VRRKLKENRGKMKKLEESMTKIHHSINFGPFVSSVLELVSKRRRTPREEGKQASKGRIRKAKESKDQARKVWIKQLQWEYLQITGCIYDFLAIFSMHGIFMCVFGSFVAIGMGFSRFRQWF